MIIRFLAIGWCVIIFWNIRRGFSFYSLLKMSWNGVKGASTVLLMLSIVGMMTGSWRASGTIAYIVTISMGLIQPKLLLISIFLLNSLVSFLIGTSFGTAATMGVISMIVANATGLNPILSGGAVMSGIYFGDRGSPISSCAMLVAEITETEILENVKTMMKTATIPFALTSILYLIMGMVFCKNTEIMSVTGLFDSEFNLSPLVLIPVFIVFSMVLLRCNVKYSMLVGCISAGFICFFVQKVSILEILHYFIFGFAAQNERIATMMNGGGFLSMLHVLSIVCLSSTYAGLIHGTGFADGLKDRIAYLAEKMGNLICMTLVSIVAVMIGCNQTLATMLTKEMCCDLYTDKKKLASDLSNTVVMIAGLVPWCIAGAVPIATIGSQTACLFTSFYLYLLPLWRIIIDRITKNKES